MNTPERNKGRNHLSGLAVWVILFAGIAGFPGCHRQAVAGQTASDSGPNSDPDPADVNMAPVDDMQQAAAQPPARGQSIENESQQQADQDRQNGVQAGAPLPQQNDQQDVQQSGQPDQSYANGQNDQAYEDEVEAGQQAIEEADQPPPPLPTYEQPEAPGPNYIWTPGYWSYAPTGYYWVPGAWVAAPYDGALWTPGYWDFYDGRYLFYPGYWGLHIGFYGGIDYGFGYTGSGYHGGYWNGNNFYYNRAVNHVNPARIPHIYNHTVRVTHTRRVAYNGGRGGIQARPNRSEIIAMRGPKIRAMSGQLQNQRQAAQNRQQFFNQNRGRPATVVSRPVGADRDIQRPVVRPFQGGHPQVRPNQPNQLRPGQPNQLRPSQPGQFNRPQARPDQRVRPNQPQGRPEQQRPGEFQNRPNPQDHPNSQVRPTQPETRQAQPQTRPNYGFRSRPAESQPRPVQPSARPVQPQRPMQPQRPVQPQNRFQNGPVQRRSQDQLRAVPQGRPESRPMQQSRPEPQVQRAAPQRPQPAQAPHNEQREHH